jgi:4-hydroxyphenylpyruvate dioxygenase-like putative hemolysin
MAEDMQCEKVQICVVVENLDEAMKRYSDLLGVGPFLIYSVDAKELGVTRDGLPTNYKVRVGMAKMGGAVLELLESLKGQTIWKDFYDKHGEGMHHIGLFVRNFPAALAAFTDRGFKITVDGPIAGKDRTGRFTYLETQERMGTTFELLDFPEDLMKAFR